MLTVIIIFIILRILFRPRFYRPFGLFWGPRRWRRPPMRGFGPYGPGPYGPGWGRRRYW